MKMIVLLATASFVVIAAPAHAGPCSKEIATVTQLLSGDTSGVLSSLGGATSSVPQAGTLSAVTGGSGRAAPAASPEALEAIDQAKQADAAGDETSCMDYINQAKQLLGLIQ